MSGAAATAIAQQSGRLANQIGVPHSPDTMESSELLADWLRRHPGGPDGRLPPERHLSESLGISRAALRTALAGLESEGRIVRHVGRGTFLVGGGAAAPGERDPSGLGVELQEMTSPRDLLQARVVVEPELARLAALHATGRQIAAIRDADAAVAAARTWPDYDTADAAYHRAIAEGSGNALLLALFGAIAAVRLGIGWGQLIGRGSGSPTGHGSHAEHAAVSRALGERDGHAASYALRHHLMVEASSIIGPNG